MPIYIKRFTVLVILGAILSSLFLLSPAISDAASSSITGEINVNASEPDIDIDTAAIKANAEDFSFGKAINKVKDISFHLLVVWILAAGILFFFSFKWAVRITVLGVLGFGVITYHEEILSMLLGLVDWIVSVGE
ncbi:hypothetical protein [Bacillus piscicola]|uniref:hypothetical protein n=1 Tax=Bacillus piscicola TaxID=1632684 RepID=UPI001F09AB69|nr:hypothetical protein [Bacillus piscicola]